jgi:ribosomal protein L27
MAKVGGLTTKFYRETKGLKVSGGQEVKAGTVLTRNGDRWKPGLNVVGQMSLTAGIDGEVYFTQKRAANKKVSTYVHIRPAKAVKPKTTKKKTAVKA